MESVADIDWAQWRPQVEAVICYLQEGDRVLLIRRLSGMAQNKISAPGGKVDAGESPLTATVREMAEEVHLKVEPQDLHRVGALHFQFTDGYSMLGHVYTLYRYQGQPRPSAEADPFWRDCHRLPFDHMWADDPLWLSYVLAGGRMNGYFLLRCDNMVDKSEVNEELLSHRIDWGLLAMGGEFNAADD